jgi:uracil-DNA glycosylase family 4
MGGQLAGLEREIVACERCPELRAYCAEVARVRRRAYRDWEYWGKPVPGFGDPGARLLLIGLAPGAHGSNRTGRMFTGDASGVWLYRALHANGFASSPNAERRDDGLRLRDCWITAAVRCAPPGNKPTHQQRTHCFGWLRDEFAALPAVEVVVTLGKLADDTLLALARDAGMTHLTPPVAFGHLRERCLSRTDGSVLTVLSSYHPSQQNTSTKKLTEPMLDAVFVRARTLLGGV